MLLIDEYIENEEENITQAFITADNISEVNMLRRSILSEIETYSIDVVIFDINFSPRHDEIIALRLGQLVIDNTHYDPEENDGIYHVIDVIGPKVFTTDDIPNIPFKFKTPICVLKDNTQRIKCKIMVKKGTSKEHVKWRPVSKITFSESEEKNKYTMQIVPNGMLSGIEIFQKGLEKLDYAKKQSPQTIFSKPVI